MNWVVLRRARGAALTSRRRCGGGHPTCAFGDAVSSITQIAASAAPSGCRAMHPDTRKSRRRRQAVPTSFGAHGRGRAPPGTVAQQRSRARRCRTTPNARRRPECAGGRRRDAGAIPAGPGSIFQHVDDMGEAPRHTIARAASQRFGPTVEGYPVQRVRLPTRPCRRLLRRLERVAASRLSSANPGRSTETRGRVHHSSARADTASRAGRRRWVTDC